MDWNTFLQNLVQKIRYFSREGNKNNSYTSTTPHRLFKYTVIDREGESVFQMIAENHTGGYPKRSGIPLFSSRSAPGTQKLKSCSAPGTLWRIHLPHFLTTAKCLRVVLHSQTNTHILIWTKVNKYSNSKKKNIQTRCCMIRPL